MPWGSCRQLPPRAPTPSSSCHYAMHLTRQSRWRTGAFSCSESERPGSTRHGSCHSGQLSGARMHRRPRLSLLRLLVVALAGACGWRTGFQPFAPGPDTSARPVGLITTGSAFARAGVQRRGAGAVGRGELGPPPRGSRAVGPAAPGTVREATTKGSVDALLFTARRGSRPIPVVRTATQVEPSALTPRPAVAALASEALRDIPPFRAPEWDTVARRLVASGCPFVALALADAGLTSARAGRAVRTAALATIREAAKHRVRRADDDAAHGLKRGEAPELPEASAPEVAADAGSSATPAPAPGQQYSCSTLCGMHMIELCNRDRILWDSHGRRWEPTTCGTMREEAFLKECYRQQWLSGAFHDACVVPCESQAEGRDRLLNLLQGAGCLRLHHR